MTLIEAMGTGLPIISCAVGGIPDMLTDEQNALLVPPDVEGVAHGMEQLYSDRVLRKRLGMAAKSAPKIFRQRRWLRNISMFIKCWSVKDEVSVCVCRNALWWGGKSYKRSRK